jgi:type II secretory pathway predicted ATPase ExeA
VYEAHFGLKRRPFRESVSPTVYVGLPSHDAVLRRLRFALEDGQGPAVLFGPAGAGKTLLARCLASELRAAAVHLTYPALPAAELVAHLADEFGGPIDPSRPLYVTLKQLRNQLATLAAGANRPLLVVDDAHLIDSVATFDAMRLLLNFAATGPPDLSLLFVGGAEVLLEIPPGLADRLAARCLLGPLTEAETSAYILGRLAAAGAKSPLFTNAALAFLHRAGDGLPRRLNHLADLALLIASSENLPVVDDRIVPIAAREFTHEAAA